MMTSVLIKPLIRLLMMVVAISFIFMTTHTIYADTTIDEPLDGSTQNTTQYALFELDIEVSGGVSPYGFTSDGLPTGYELIVNEARTAAKIEGATTQTGTFPVTIEVSDSDEGNITTDEITFTIEVAAVDEATTIVIDFPNSYELPEGVANESYATVTFSTTDDDDTYTWAIISGGLPDGLLLSSGDGQIIGTPTESGEFPFTIQATDPDGDKDPGARAYKITVTGSSGTGDLEISSPTSANLPTGILGESYNVDVNATGGDGIYTFTQSGLPGGLSINSGTGIISGTPVGTGTFNVDITVTDNSGETATREYTLTILETGEAGYDSDPSPGSTIDFGNVNVNATYSLGLIVMEVGTGDLEITEPSGGFIQGVDDENFRITDNDPPFTINDGDDDVVVRITCVPDEARDFTALLRFNTNDDENSAVVYSLFCTGVLDGGNEDDEDVLGDDDTTDDTIVDDSTATPSIPTQTPLPPTYSNVIEVDGLSLRTGPFIGASRRGVLRPDTNYRVTAKNNQEGVYMWYYIVTDDGMEGWASGRYLAVYGQDVPFAGSVLDNVWNERDRGVRVKAYDNTHFRPGPSDRTQPYPDLIPWAGIMTVYGRTTSGRGDEWYAVEYNGVRGWVYAGVVEVVEGLMEAIPKY